MLAIAGTLSFHLDLGQRKKLVLDIFVQAIYSATEHNICISTSNQLSDYLNTVHTRNLSIDIEMWHYFGLLLQKK